MRKKLEDITRIIPSSFLPLKKWYLCTYSYFYFYFLFFFAFLLASNFQREREKKCSSLNKYYVSLLSFYRILPPALRFSPSPTSHFTCSFLSAGLISVILTAPPTMGFGYAEFIKITQSPLKTRKAGERTRFLLCYFLRVIYCSSSFPFSLQIINFTTTFSYYRGRFHFR